MLERTQRADTLSAMIAGLSSKIAAIERIDGKGKSYYIGFMPSDLFDAHHWTCENHQDAIKLMEQISRRLTTKRGKDYGSKQTMIYLIPEKEQNLG